MSQSILDGIKKKLNIDISEDAFDEDELIDCVNAGFANLNQIGVYPEKVFSITSSENTWDEFTTDPIIRQFAKIYMFLYVKQIFDISGVSSNVVESYEKKLKEFEWRLHLQGDIVDKEEHE